MNKVLLIIPPFTQINTPYPSTPYLKGFLNSKNIQSSQVDLSNEVVNQLFSAQGLKNIFDIAIEKKQTFSKNAERILKLKNEYLNTINHVITFLQGNNSTLSYQICNDNFLPKASRFQQITDLEWAFGIMGYSEKAKHLATLYLEDISDFITETIDPNFGFSRYAEKLGRYAHNFDKIELELNKPPTYVQQIMFELLEQKIIGCNPTIIGISVPFAGNIFSALCCGKWIKEHYPDIKIIMGGGFCNTELRSISDKRFFSYFDFLTLDDGEIPIFQIIQYLDKNIEINDLKRTFVLKDDIITFYDNNEISDCSINKNGTPDYSDLHLNKYISAIEIANPMHNLWSNGFWNKLSLAHGCYWAKCSFCDTSLDYISRFEPSDIEIFCNKIEEIVEKTGQTGFHFVDEAAPPNLLKQLAIELIRRRIKISWWTNIRFEKTFTYDLCYLLKEAGCIAVSGGLEVASDRLLKLINKGVTVEQVAKAAFNFSRNGIMVHAYLMYGFPTQSEQETIDSLEVVRQLFENRIVNSAFWHQFSMTVHSEVGKNPEKYYTKISDNQIGKFANNDLHFIDSKGCEHEKFSEGLRKSLLNFMHEIGFDFELSEWFDFKIHRTKIPKDYIYNIIKNQNIENNNQNNIVVWLSNIPTLKIRTKNKKGNTFEISELIFENKNKQLIINCEHIIAKWLLKILPELTIENIKKYKYPDLKSDFENFTNLNFEDFIINRNFKILKENGLIFV